MCSVNFKHFSCDYREHPLSFPSKKGVLPKQNSHEALSFDSKNLLGL